MSEVDPIPDLEEKLAAFKRKYKKRCMQLEQALRTSGKATKEIEKLRLQIDELQEENAALKRSLRARHDAAVR